MSGMFRLNDEAALAEFLGTRHVREHKTSLAAPRLVQPMGEQNKGGAPFKPDKPVKVKKLPPRSDIEALMSQQIMLGGLPKPVEWPERFRPIEDRRIEVDFCWTDRRVILEVDGNVHRIKGTFKRSFERSFLLLMDNWNVLHVGGDEVRSGLAFDWLQQFLAKHQPRE